MFWEALQRILLGDPALSLSLGPLLGGLIASAVPTVLGSLFGGGGRSQPAAQANPQLAEQAGIGRAAMTQMLDGLESSGWIKRSPSKQDRRKLSVKLTPKAKRTLDRFLPDHYARVSKLLENLSPADRRQITILLAAVESRLPTPR